jgi:VWFA-related protein
MAAATGQVGQDEPFSISVEVAMVGVDAIVQEPGGRFLTDLTEKDFEIFENGRPQEIASFASTDTPRSVLLLFDLSGSTGTQRPFMGEALNLVVARLRRQDRIALASFATQFEFMLNWRTVGGKPLDFWVNAPQPGSDFYWALERAIESFKNEKDRKAIIVMTDGRDSPMFNDVLRLRRILSIEEDKNFQKLVLKVRKQAIPMYFIAMNTDRNRDQAAREFEYTSIAESMGQAAADRYLVAVRSRMEHLADATGGRILYPRALSDVGPLYDAIGRDLGYAYSLAYTSKGSAPDGKARRIEVRVRRNGLKVTQSRDSYMP